LYNGCFKNLDNQEKTYWFGFLVGDGNIYLGNQRKTVYQFSIVSKDKEHVEKLATFLGYSVNRIRVIKGRSYQPSNNYYLLSIWCKELVIDLMNLGLTPRKSHTVNSSIIPKNKYIWDFIRGLWDADGCIMTKNINSDLVFEPVVSLTGNYPLLESISNIINDGGYLHENRSINGSADRLVYGGRLKVERILDKIYYTNPSLERKFKLYISIKEYNDKYRIIDPQTDNCVIYINNIGYFERTCLYCGNKILVMPCKTKNENWGNFCNNSCSCSYYWKLKKEVINYATC